ncbi:hypothetical protein C8J57DRAFT_1570560, partial [Mycena rebaudengoi]
ARLRPLSEAAVISYISSLTTLQSILSLLLEPVDAMVLTSSPPMSGVYYNDTGCTVNATARECSLNLVIGFMDLLLPFNRELELRLNADNVAGFTEHTHARRVVPTFVTSLLRLALRKFLQDAAKMRQFLSRQDLAEPSKKGVIFCSHDPQNVKSPQTYPFVPLKRNAKKCPVMTAVTGATDGTRPSAPPG